MIEIKEIFYSIAKLRYADRPDYDFIRKQLHSLLHKEELKEQPSQETNTSSSVMFELLYYRRKGNVHLLLLLDLVLKGNLVLNSNLFCAIVLLYSINLHPNLCCSNLILYYHVFILINILLTYIITHYFLYIPTLIYSQNKKMERNKRKESQYHSTVSYKQEAFLHFLFIDNLVLTGMNCNLTNLSLRSMLIRNSTQRFTGKKW